MPIANKYNTMGGRKNKNIYFSKISVITRLSKGLPD